MLPYSKNVIAICDGDVTAAETSTGVIDTLGADFMTLDVIMGTADAVSNNPSTLTLYQGAAGTALTDGTAITSLTGDGVGGFTIPNAVTSGKYVVRFNLDLEPYKRYVYVAVTPLYASPLVVSASLFRNGEMPISATKANVTGLVEG